MGVLQSSLSLALSLTVSFVIGVCAFFFLFALCEPYPLAFALKLTTIKPADRWQVQCVELSFGFGFGYGFVSARLDSARLDSARLMAKLVLVLLKIKFEFEFGFGAASAFERVLCVSVAAAHSGI